MTLRANTITARVFDLTKTNDYVTSNQIARVLGKPITHVAPVLSDLYYRGYLDRTRDGKSFFYIRREAKTAPRKRSGQVRASRKTPAAKGTSSARVKVEKTTTDEQKLTNLLNALHEAMPVLEKFQRVSKALGTDL